MVYPHQWIPLMIERDLEASWDVVSFEGGAQLEEWVGIR